MKTVKITIQETSNPSILKFEADTFLTKYESFEFDNVDEANISPIAQQLFYLPFVKKIYISGNFIAIECSNIVEWKDVQDEVATQIEDYLNAGGIVINPSSQGKKTPVTIYAESTPNPAAMKFVANKNLVTSTFEYASIDEAEQSPIATALFNFPFVKNVFIHENYISITKYDIAEWNDITMELREFIKNHIENGKDIVLADAPEIRANSEAAKAENFENLSDTSKQIVNILEEYVKPAVVSDGGNIEFESYNEESKVVKVILQGACSGCPSSTYTLKTGIENMLQQMLKDKDLMVEAVNG
jgi:Fe-S cluster biogenesis protein NfuA